MLCVFVCVLRYVSFFLFFNVCLCFVCFYVSSIFTAMHYKQSACGVQKTGEASRNAVVRSGEASSDRAKPKYRSGEAS